MLYLQKKEYLCSGFSCLTLYMHFAIIAAGEGSRLREEGIVQPKPLALIEGQPMIGRLMDIMVRCGAESLSVIANAESPEVSDFLRIYAEQHPELPFHLVVESTPSSMHSLARLSEVIPEGKVCVTTVDTIFREKDFAAYVSAFAQTEGSLFAATPFVDDEKPLWVEAAPDGGIYGFHDEASMMTDAGHLLWVSGGIYGLESQSAWPVLRRCVAEGQFRMRNFQRALVAAGIPLRAFIIDKVLDIDHACDLNAAEALLRENRILAVRRAHPFSPSRVEADAAILGEVEACFAEDGYEVMEVEEDDFASMPTSEIRRFGKVFHMARRMATLHKLSMLDVPVVNRPQSVMCVSKSREMTFSMLQQADVPLPRWWAYDPEEDEMFQCEPALQELLPGWVKAMRTDGVRAGDVTLVTTSLEADSRVMELAAQSVPDIVVMQHVEGDLLKVYVVMSAADSDDGGMFLQTFYPQENGYSKFGISELYNTPLARNRFRQERLKEIARRIGAVLRLEVFGFDAIVEPDGNIVVIDVNDWPSFSVCRNASANAIRHLYDS